MTWTRLIEGLVLPPIGLIWLGLVGLILWHRRRHKGAVVCLVTSLLGLLLLAMPFTSAAFLRSVDRYPPLSAMGALPDAEAVVILGAGTRDGAREYGADSVSGMALERLRYGAWLARRTGSPILVTGWSHREMAECLAVSFQTDARWRVGGNNTYENAVFSAKSLHSEGIRRVYLVTHFWHMPRAMAVFRAQGFAPVPAPHGFSESSRGGFASWLPNVASLGVGRRVLHEWVGRLWYRARWGV